MVEKECISKNILPILYLSFPNVTFTLALQFYFIYFGAGFEVLTVVRIHNA